jgi:(1->4)-alpha-D-glucan 1-alpha-D-glucosylmutase
MYFPSATYRIQLNSGYTLDQLKTIIPYLHKLGISTIYGAPITTSTKGSTHGYDVINPDIFNPEIGTEPQLKEIAVQLQEYGMGWLQDIVPNHMAYSIANERLADVLERGPQSPYYNYFDTNWNHYDPKYKGKVMVPFIGKDLDEAIDGNEIKLAYKENGFCIDYYDNLYPIAIDTYSYIFSFLENEQLDELDEEIYAQVHLGLCEWISYKKAWLEKLKPFEGSLQKAVEKINGDKSLLRKLLSRQYYVLTWYKVTEQEINFRRFFTVNSLICLHMENERVFNDYHQFIYRLYKNNLVQGLRIDHIDGLYNPQQYVRRLRKLFGENAYIIAEKILEYNEDIASDWDLQGTSGYEFLSFTNQLLSSKAGGEKLLNFYKELVPGTPEYEEMVFAKKHHFLFDQMGGELENLLHLAEDLKIFEHKQYNREALKKALGVLMASFPVYRIYPTSYPLNEVAVPIVEKAFDKASKHVDDVQHELGLLREVFFAEGTKQEDADKLLFLMRLMQFTGPLAAKGVEDTTFYVYNPLISHNDVGDAPAQLGISIQDFHNKMLSRQQNNPYSLNGTSTHDTKRGEDGRTRINVLAEMADEWIEQVNNWRQMNKSFIKTINGKPAPSANDEYFIYQSLIGSFPEDLQITDSYLERSHAFIEKALREAKVETTYTEPNTEYEEACKSFITAVLDSKNAFLQSFVPFLEKVIAYATIYSLEQVLVKITAPGIPDVYQGCELWDLSYVDPDNRRPIDYQCRMEALDGITQKESEGADAVLSFIQQHKKEGREKLFVTYKALNFRNKHNWLFLAGEYIPIASNDNVVAYARNYNDQWALIAFPVNIKTITESKGSLLGEQAWDNNSLQLPEGAPMRWRNVFTGESVGGDKQVLLKEVFGKFPVALLEGE